MFLCLLSLAGLAIACADHDLHSRDGYAHAHVHGQREYLQFPLTPPYRPLVWGDFNVIHTTDTHGWLLGHQKPNWPEPNYSGDLGDFASFITHMKQIAIDKNVDLLLVDSGDLHDGTGLSDGYPPGDVDGHESNQFLERIPYDLMAIGNHELYEYDVVYDMYTNFVPQLNGYYLSSNVNITIFDTSGVAVSVPVGNRFVKFTTSKGRSVTSLGVLYDFTGNSVNTTVHTVAKMVKEPWFVEAIAEEPDVFLLIGHMPVSNDNWPTVFNAVRAVHPYTPVLIFGGHSHIRDCQQYDGRSMSLESGRYMETIGADLDAAKGNTDNITFSRRYLDQNRITYEYHTSTSNSTFDTTNGQSITLGLQQLAVNFDLDYLYGTAPQDYTMYRNPYPSNGSVFTLFISEAAPVALSINNTRAGIPNRILSNSGALRYDVFRGSFTKNDLLTATPFTDAFLYIPNVTAGVANQVLSYLNAGSPAKRSEVDGELWGQGHVEPRFRRWLEAMSGRPAAVDAIDTTDLTPGYVTTDGCPDAGDDTLHTALPYYSVPGFIASDAPVDLVFVDFIEGGVLGALNAVQTATQYTTADVSPYTPTLLNAVLGLYAQTAWTSARDESAL